VVSATFGGSAELKGIPVVVVWALPSRTYFHSQKDLDQYRGAAIPEPSAYIEKPPEADEILETIQRVVKS